MITPTPMTPGTYLRLRREAAGLSIDDVALMTETLPHVPAIRRAEYLRDIEDGTMKIGDSVTLQLTPFAAQQRFPFDPGVLAELVAIERGKRVAPPLLCLRCGCSGFDPCGDGHGATCGRPTDDEPLCTACIVAEAEASFAPQPEPTAPGPAA